MATVPNLDMSQPIAKLANELTAEGKRNGYPSPYFEELWHTLARQLENFEQRINALENP